MELIGNYSSAKIFTDNVDSNTISQIYDFLNTKMVENEVVRIMPDCHSGSGCVVGYTQTYSGGPIDPEVIGVDCSCGVLSVKYELTNDINLELWDSRVRKNIPMGMNINDKTVIPEKEFFKFFKNKLERARSLWPEYIKYEGLGNIERFISDKLKKLGMEESVFYKSLGSLGGGNHFIELGQTENDKNSIWLTIHTGSRNLGVKILSYWKKQMNKTRILKSELKSYEKKIREDFKGSSKKIKEEIEKLHKSGKCTIPPSRFLTLQEDISSYLEDMFFAHAYAEYNRLTIANRIKKALGFGRELEKIESVHNYISLEDHIIRKGAIKAYSGEKIVIPMNMAFGTLICSGYSNEDWNYSAPHGAGRLMSREKAKQTITMEDFKKSMSGVYSSSICYSCIDESPNAYKNPEEIISCIKNSLDIIEIIKPLVSIKDGTELLI